jgi:outer membrane protein OmpA-like peptidoglycan-associated protein
MHGRGGIVQFDKASADLDVSDKSLVEKLFSERRGASYFFVVSRASPEGSIQINRELSRSRAEAVMSHLQTTFNDPDLEQRVGLLWLGEEYAQLDPSFCKWERSGEAIACTPEDLNRSAFITWIDCRL